MFRKYKDYNFACCPKKNFIISQLHIVLSNAVFVTAAFMCSLLLVRFLFPLFG